MRITLMICLILSNALVAAPNAIARTTIYKSVMPDGRVVYSEQPQSGARTTEKSMVNINDTGMKPISREAVEGASQRALQRSRALDEASESVRTAETELRAAEREREAGREPLPGERLGIAGSGTRLLEEYFQRQQMLEDRVDNARKQLESAQQKFSNIR